jgi:hypothetical protein
MTTKLPTPTGASQHVRAALRRIACAVRCLPVDVTDWLHRTVYRLTIVTIEQPYWTLRYSRLTDPFGTRARARPGGRGHPAAPQPGGDQDDLLRRADAHGHSHIRQGNTLRELEGRSPAAGARP